MPRSRKRSAGKTPDHITKARLVEEIAAMLHEREGVTVERNVRLPPLTDPNQVREIDVLVTGNIASYPVRIAIECKNYSDRISVGQIGEFKDKLDDVGLSVRDSVYISVVGFTRDARRRAREYGIKLFELEGLTANRLSSEVHQAFQSKVYHLLEIRDFTFQSYGDRESLGSVMLLRDRRGNTRGGLYDLIWEQWQRGEIPSTWGEQELEFQPPTGWHWNVENPDQIWGVTATLRVIGLVLTATGEAYRHVLHDILDQKYDRLYIRTIFHDTPDAIKVTVVESEEELQAATRPGGITNIVFDSERAPRINVLNKMYWPPTERAMAIMQGHIDTVIANLLEGRKPNWDALQDVTFEVMEGTDIGAIWGKGWSGHPPSRGDDWPVKFPPPTPKPVRRVPGSSRNSPYQSRLRRPNHPSS